MIPRDCHIAVGLRRTLRPWASVCLILGVLASSEEGHGQPDSGTRWQHLSSANGDLPVPMPGTQQTACLVLDIDKDDVNDFVVTERTATPSVVWFRRTDDGWRRYVIDNERLNIEAGGAFHDLDRDGDLDLVFGNDASGRQMWWWENPFPDFAVDRPWKRHLIKDSGGNKHHDQLIGDVDGDGAAELVFWNQRARQLCRAEIPADPKAGRPWPYDAIYSWDEEREHEGLALVDVDADGTLDVVGGGNWYRHEGNGRFVASVIDPAMRFTRAAGGQLKKGGWAEIVLVPGDADGPLKWYEWDGGAWRDHTLEAHVTHGHTLHLGDVNGDDHLDVFVAEMGRWGRDNTNAEARMLLFFGDGKGHFTRRVVATGYGNHESKLADLDGDGDLDILGKPYNWNTPRIDIWLNQTTGQARPAPRN